jgi:transcriptional regulator with XRE-family HTH domain
MADSPEAQRRREQFGERLRRRRMAFGLMQVELSKRADVPQAAISHLENGRYHAVNLTTLARLAQALNTTTDYLLGLSDEAGEITERVLQHAVA